QRRHGRAAAPGGPTDGDGRVHWTLPRPRRARLVRRRLPRPRLRPTRGAGAAGPRPARGGVISLLGPEMVIETEESAGRFRAASPITGSVATASVLLETRMSKGKIPQ